MIKTNKKQALVSKKERLLRELLELDDKIETVVEEEWKEYGETILSNIDILLELVPTHTDGTVDEGHDDPACLRCVLLQAKLSDEWLYKQYGVDITLDIKDDSDSIDGFMEDLVQPATAVTEPVKRQIETIKKELSPNQKKAIELGKISADELEPEKLKRVLEINEDDVDLPDNWS